MVGKEFIVDLDSIDFDRVLADVHEIRKYNPQRFEMEQLSAIVHEDPQNVTCVGYKDVAHDEFWVRGHMPGMPLMPGVVMLEAVAQVAGAAGFAAPLIEAMPANNLSVIFRRLI